MSDDFEKRVRQSGEFEAKEREAKRAEEVRQRVEGERRLANIEAAIHDWHDKIFRLIEFWATNANRPGEGLYVRRLPEPIREITIPGLPPRAPVSLPSTRITAERGNRRSEMVIGIDEYGMIFTSVDERTELTIEPSAFNAEKVILGFAGRMLP